MELIKTTFPIEGFIESRKGGRPENQDYLDYRDTAWGFLTVVCDGMGGGPAGRVASSTAVDSIIGYIDQKPFDQNISGTSLLEESIVYANNVLTTMQVQNPSLRGLGTTVTALLINSHSASLAYVGDSRIYQFRFGRKIFRTIDHSQVMELVKVGTLTEEEARNAPNSNVITRALGVSDVVKVDTFERPYEIDDRFVLCSDGVWGSMPEKELIPLLAQTKTISGTVEKTMINVEEIGKANGSHHDNFTIAIVKTNSNSKLTETMSHKTRKLLLTLIVICGISILANIIMAFMIVNKDQSVETSTNLLHKVEEVNIDSIVQSQISVDAKKRDKIWQDRLDSLALLLKQANSNAAKDFVDGIHKAEQNKKDLASEVDSLICQCEILSETLPNKDISQKEIDNLKNHTKSLSEHLRKNAELAKIADNIDNNIVPMFSHKVAQQACDEKKNQRAGHYKYIISKFDSCKSQILSAI